jgi:hypothetical protein
MAAEKPSSSSSQSAPLPKPLTTRRTTQRAAPAVSTVHSATSVRGSDVPHSVSCTKRRGGSQPVMRPSCSPDPMSKANVPASESTVVSCSHEEMPGPVAIARHTSSGVPATLYLPAELAGAHDDGIGWAATTSRCGRPSSS